MKKLYSFYWDCGRSGSIDGLFIAEEYQIQKIIGEQVYFGEVLGKHSEIFGTLEEADFEVKSDDPAFIDKMIEIFGDGTVSGYNPLDYIEEISDDIDDDHEDGDGE